MNTILRIIQSFIIAIQKKKKRALIDTITFILMKNANNVLHSNNQFVYSRAKRKITPQKCLRSRTTTAYTHSGGFSHYSETKRRNKESQGIIMIGTDVYDAYALNPKIKSDMKTKITSVKWIYTRSPSLRDF